MRIIGVTGKSGAGKSTFAYQLCKMSQGIVHIDVDEIGRKALQLPHVVKELIRLFGDDIVDKEGHIKTNKLGDIVFNNRDRYKEIKGIIWPIIEDMIDLRLENYIGNKTIIIDWILLPKTKYFSCCDVKYLVKREKSVRMESVLARDKITVEQFELREKNSIEYLDCDFDNIVINTGRTL